jgi:hypothetical protein
MPFKGTPAPGGRRDGSGRKADWLQKECAGIVEKRNLLIFLGDVADGKPVKQSVAIDGKMAEAKVSADVKDRLRALDMLLDRGWGKAPQSVEVSGELTGRICVIRAES